MSRDRNTWRTRGWLAVGAVALAALLAGATTSGAGAAQGPANRGHGAPVVSTSGGAIKGVATATTDKFLGVPYAAPPVGALRWRAPQPAARWHGVRDATQFAPHCAQPAGPFGKGSTSEDCLYLNVFTPANHSGRPLPVMVWIHGGALVTGESDDYDPTNLVGDGAIVVTINYRLGALGFLAHPALLGQGGSSGNYGLMDQQAALRWVQQNIGQFGGDKHNVSIFGESAGGLSVLSQVASKGARGLFDKAIVESGTYNLTQTSLADAETAGEAFATKAGCANQNAASQTAACLRGLPVSTIVADENQSGYTPDLDGVVLTQSLRPAFASGQFNRVPIINGTNHDEWRLFVALDTLAGMPVTAANYQSTISSTLGVPATVAAVIAAQYPLSAFPSPPVALGAVGTDAIFACNAFTVDQSVSKFVPTYSYEFNDENAPQDFLPAVGFPYGAAHASEIQYVFNTAASQVVTGLSAQQVRLAGTMQRYWTNFAARGFPSSFGTPFWAPFHNVSTRTQSFVAPTPTVETNFSTEHHCAFWNAAA
ncbi:MAG TPA: carboxylesterase family protein [Pseudonocardiaceae bacterium]|nr:carboxylesterase family protein [Pseudonocardiaceae bacterium]